MTGVLATSACRARPARAANALLVLLAILLAAPLALAQRDLPAPEFPTDLEWLNVQRPLTLSDLRGKIVLLDFFTFGCINCIHVIPDLHELEAKYAEELVVIGVHSAKFEHEGDTENIRRFAERYRLTHPIVNDRDFGIWRAYGIYAWPSAILIDPDGQMVASHAGEGYLAAFDEQIAAMALRFDERGTLDRTPLELGEAGAPQPDSTLRYPGKVLADAAGDRLFIADTNHHRIVVTSLEGRVQAVIGSGEPGLRDGGPQEARFLRPQGLTLAGPDTLYLADTGNHSIRRIDLTSGAVMTVAGTGEQEYMFDIREAPARGTGLNSPWDVLFVDGQLYIAMAGQHQIWRYDPIAQTLHLHAGSGREQLRDARLLGAGLNQPSGLASDGTELFVADSEASAVRAVDIDAGGSVRTIVGEGLFEFGDTDGRGDRVRLQHPKGVTFADGVIYVADTYNNKIKRLDPDTRRSETFLGNGEAGWRDGEQPLFYEPGGLSVAGDLLYIADTNNHSIRVADLGSGEVHTLLLDDSQGLLTRARPMEFFGEVVNLREQRVAPGPGRLVVTINLPRWYKSNELAPLSVSWSSNAEAVTVDPGRRTESVAAPRYPLTLEVPAYFAAGRSTVTADLNIYYCREGAEALCLVDRVRLDVPIEVAGREFAGAPEDNSVTIERRPPPVPTRR
jgi:thiol-disulfide isomerase/thioredoxin/sugar lactone lactonase YvrE